MCLALDVERPEAAVADPSRLVIKAIHPTRITADSFVQALTHALRCGRPAEEVSLPWGGRSKWEGAGGDDGGAAGGASGAGMVST